MALASLKSVLSSALLFLELSASGLGLVEVGLMQCIPQYLVSYSSSVVSEQAEGAKGKLSNSSLKLAQIKHLGPEGREFCLVQHRKKKKVFQSKCLQPVTEKGDHIILYSHLLIQEVCLEYLLCV